MKRRQRMQGKHTGGGLWFGSAILQTEMRFVSQNLPGWPFPSESRAVHEYRIRFRQLHQLCGDLNQVLQGTWVVKICHMFSIARLAKLPARPGKAWKASFSPLPHPLECHSLQDVVAECDLHPHLRVEIRWNKLIQVCCGTQVTCHCFALSIRLIQLSQ